LSKPITFASKQLLLDYAKRYMQQKLGLDIDFLYKESILLKTMKSQTKLKQFF